MKRLLITLLVALLPVQAWSQATVLQGGTWSPGRAPAYSSSGGAQPIVQDSGPAGGNTTGQGLKELNITARGTGTAPFAGQGTGPNGEVFCIQDAVSTNSTGYHYLCLSANVSSSGLISYGSAGGASALPLTLKVNGTDYQFPFTDGYVVGPASSTVNNVACWNNTTGTLLKDCGTFLSVGGSANQIQYNAAGSFGGFTMSGDCAVTVATGVILCTKSNGVNISLGGALTTVGALSTAGGAFSLTLTLGANTNVTLPNTGTLATLAGSEALTNKTYNGNTWTAGTGVLTIAAAKTFTASNTLTLTATDGSTLAIGTGGTLGTAAYTASSAYVPSGTQITNSLSGDVALNNTANYFDGPSVAQGSTGTWCASGTVTVKDTAGAASNIYAKLWDGTTTIASTATQTTTAGTPATISLSGCLATPAGNLRISVRDVATTTGVIQFNQTGLSKDATITAYRVQ